MIFTTVCVCVNKPTLVCCVQCLHSCFWCQRPSEMSSRLQRADKVTTRVRKQGCARKLTFLAFLLSTEEEIDVVTVVRCSSSPSPLPSLADLSARQQKQEEEQRALQRHHFEIQMQHNYAAPCPASPPPSSSSSSHKRSRGSDSSSRFHHSSRSSSSSSSSSSRYHHHHSSRNSTETEDEEERRRTHNVMERQRRNELKNCFVRLRDNVPELSHNDKASKVVILKKARDCIYGLEDEGHRLKSKRDRLRAKQEELKARLEQLRS